jgi:hypothetical protein
VKAISWRINRKARRGEKGAPSNKNEVHKTWDI